MKKSVLILITLFIASSTFVISALQADEPVANVVSDEVANEMICGEKYEIKDHMTNMGFIIRSLNEAVDVILKKEEAVSEVDPVLMAEIMKKTQLLRIHLSAVFPKTPKKLQAINPGDLQGSKLIFQRYLLILMNKSVDLEEELLKKPQTTQEIEEQKLNISKTIIAIYNTVEIAHSLFRE